MGCDVGIFGMALGRAGEFSNLPCSDNPPMQSPTPPTPAAPAGVPASAPIVLATLNAKFIHASLGLRCLLANMDRHGGAGLRAQTALREFVIQQRPTQIVEDLLALKPRVIGLGV